MAECAIAAAVSKVYEDAAKDDEEQCLEQRDLDNDYCNPDNTRTNEGLLKPSVNSATDQPKGGLNLDAPMFTFFLHRYENLRLILVGALLTKVQRSKVAAQLQCMPNILSLKGKLHVIRKRFSGKGWNSDCLSPHQILPHLMVSLSSVYGLE